MNSIIKLHQLHGSYGLLTCDYSHCTCVICSAVFCLQGAFTFRGNMIDMPLLRQAKNIVSLQQLVSESVDAKQSKDSEKT